jgi:hypothetical protein
LAASRSDSEGKGTADFGAGLLVVLDGRDAAEAAGWLAGWAKSSGRAETR